MGEREGSITSVEGNLEYDPSYLVAQEVAHRLTPIDDVFSEGKIDRDTYFNKIDLLKDKLLEQNKNYPEDQFIVKLVCDSSLVIRSACQRFSREVKSSRENLALAEADWQIELAKYFLKCESQPATAPITNLCLDRFKKTLKDLRFDDEYTEGVVRGVRGLLATVSVLRASAQQVELPTPKQDAEGKVDLISVNNNQRYFWQIKTVAVDRNPSIIGIDKRRVSDPDNREFVDSANILFDSAKKAQVKDGLTTKAVYIILPEPQIDGETFAPKQTITNSINEYLEGDKKP